MKLMKLFAVLALAGMSNAAFGYNIIIRNRSTQDANVTLTFGGAGGQQHNVRITPGVGQGFDIGLIGNPPFRRIDINGINMDYNPPAAIRNISFEITEDVAGNLNLNEAQ